MKVLYIMNDVPDHITTEIMNEQKRSHTVMIVDVTKDIDYDDVVDLIESSDRVISW